MIFKSENSTAEMADILQELHKYVPTLYDDKRKVINIVESIPLGGDQLTEERAINCQNGFLDGENEYEMQKGVTPNFEDWHLKKLLYEVCYNIIYIVYHI